jgi:hypothetical protein
MENHIFFELCVAVPISEEQEKQINEKLKFKSKYWGDLLPVYTESLEEKYKKVLQNKQVNYRRYDGQFNITVKGFTSINEMVELFKTFEGKIESYYVDEFFSEKIKRCVGSLLPKTT